MALVSFPGYSRLSMHSVPEQISQSNSQTLDATNEEIWSIGVVVLSSGPGTSKVISATGGGKIMCRLTTVTMADAGTSFYIGIQDVDNTTGNPDGTFDVYGNMTSANPFSTTIGTFYNMTSGTKTIAHGDVIAIGIKAVAIGGTDRIVIVTNTTTAGGYSSLYPYRNLLNTGSYAKSGVGPAIYSIVTDDGTLGWILQAEQYPNSNSGTAQNMKSDDALNEFGLIFKLPFKSQIGGAVFFATMTGGSSFDYYIYSDPYGTPVQEASGTHDTDIAAAGAGRLSLTFSTPFTIEKDTWYAIGFRPLTTTSLAIYYRNLISASLYNQYIDMMNFESILASRSYSGAGAFAKITDYYIPMFSLLITQIDDGTSTGGEASHVF